MTAKQSNSEKNTDELLIIIKQLVEGDVKNKLQAVDTLFNDYYKLPRQEAENLLLDLANIKQPEEVRIRIAERLASHPHISWGLYLKLLSALQKDDSVNVKRIIEDENKKMEEMIKPFQESFNIYKESLANFLNSLSLRDYASLYQKVIQERFEPFRQMLQNIQLSETSLRSLLAFYEENNKLSQILIKAVPIVNFYPLRELTVIDTIEAVKPAKLAEKLIRKLQECPTGRDHWKTYQDICKEILEFLFVPPLLSVEGVWTEGGMERRDLIFDIPYDANAFWNYIRTFFKASSIVVECKNYSEPLPPNEVVITSKYFGEKRCGLFGLLLTRKGLSKSAEQEQKRLWQEDDKMIVCLKDDDLVKMILLKENDEDPEKIIDQKIADLRRS